MEQQQKRMSKCVVNLYKPLFTIWWNMVLSPGTSPQYITSQKLIENESTKNYYQINLIMVYTIHHTATSYHNSLVTLNLPSCNIVDIRVIWLQWMKSNANEYWHPGFTLGLQYWGELSNFEGENLYWYISITYRWVTYFEDIKFRGLFKISEYFMNKDE